MPTAGARSSTVKRHRDDLYSDDPDAGPSKTQVKQAMHDLQDLGVELLKLPAAHLAAIPMDERLREALHQVPRMPTRESKRRLMQYVGKLLRDTDSEPARLALLEYRTGDARTLQQAEHWRNALLADDAAFTDWITAHPHTEVQPLRALIRNARRERLAGADAGPAADPVANPVAHPAARGNSPAYRALFQKLRTTLQAAPAASSSTEPRAPE